MTPITTEDLLALTKSADLLRQTAEKAMRCDSIEKERNALHGELQTQARHAEEARAVLRSILTITGRPDKDGINFSTGLEFSLAELPHKVAELAKQAEQCQSWRDEFVKAENKASRAEERANSAGLQAIALNQEMDATKTRNRGLWERAGAAESRVNELLHEKLNLEQQLGDAVSLKNQLDARIGELLRENETLARNMPPEPPAEEPFKRPGIVQVMDYSFPQSEGRTTKVIGQQWCRVNHENDVRPDALGLKVASRGWICLCNVHRDTTTGALTYCPLAVKDLPVVP